VLRQLLGAAEVYLGLRHRARRLARSLCYSLAFAAAAAIVAMVAVAFLALALFFVLSAHLDPAWAAAIVAAVFLLAAGILIAVVARRLSRGGAHAATPAAPRAEPEAGRPRGASPPLPLEITIAALAVGIAAGLLSDRKRKEP